MFQKIKNIYHLIQAIVASLLYGFPSQKLKVIGVTGTDGKTTTTHLLYHILTAAGKKVSMVSSIYAKVGDNEFDTGFHVTTPDVFPLKKLLSESVSNGDEYFVLETTSHALYQNRVFGIRYEIGILTNVTHEHLDMHHTLEEYTKIKSALLKDAKYAVANADDSSFTYIKSLLPKKKIYPYSLKTSPYFKNLDLAEFNKQNYLAAYTACKLLGLADQEIYTAFSSFTLPKGRLEILSTKPFTTIIDFAHTPNGIQAILKEVKKSYVKKDGRLIHVFGSAGKRDATKRQSMGISSGTFSDFVILTEEDYRDEDPVKIANEIAGGLIQKGFKTVNQKDFGKKTKTYIVVTDRKKAIKEAIRIAQKGDVVIATGKGHETSLCRGIKEYPWDEKKAFYDNLRS